MRVLDLFAGIGGFAIASHWCGFETAQFVEIDSFCQKVLAKNFPGVPIHDDVTTFTATRGQYDIITFGSPCQDFSSANAHGRGLEGERSGLFYEAIRLVDEVRPQFAVFENVTGVFNRGFERILWAFTEIGYVCEWQVVSAASMGAPHRRERLFVVAYPHGLGQKGKRVKSNSQRWEVTNGQTLLCSGTTENHTALCAKTSANPEGFGRVGVGDAKNNGKARPQINASNNDSQASTNSQSSGRKSSGSQDDETGANQTPVSGGGQGQERATIGRVRYLDDGLPSWLDGTSSYWLEHPAPPPLTVQEPNRNKRLKALGNAVTPQQALVPLLRVKELAEA